MIVCCHLAVYWWETHPSTLCHSWNEIHLHLIPTSAHHRYMHKLTLSFSRYIRVRERCTEHCTWWKKDWLSHGEFITLLTFELSCFRDNRFFICCIFCDVAADTACLTPKSAIRQNIECGLTDTHIKGKVLTGSGRGRNTHGEVGTSSKKHGTTTQRSKVHRYRSTWSTIPGSKNGPLCAPDSGQHCRNIRDFLGYTAGTVCLAVCQYHTRNVEYYQNQTAPSHMYSHSDR